jgi:hypothetical protein
MAISSHVHLVRSLELESKQHFVHGFGAPVGSHCLLPWTQDIVLHNARIQIFDTESELYRKD